MFINSNRFSVYRTWYENLDLSSFEIQLGKNFLIDQYILLNNFPHWPKEVEVGVRRPSVGQGSDQTLTDFVSAMEIPLYIKYWDEN